MITLVLVFCLTTDAQSCVEKRPALNDVSWMGCQLAVQPMAQRFLEAHPGYFFKRGTCGFATRRQAHA